MSLLDDLKKEAQAKSRQAGAVDTTQQKTERNWHLLAPKMSIIYAYYKELAENLNVVGVDDRRSYQLAPSIPINQLQLKNFRLAKNNDGDLRSFSFRYDLVGERDVKIPVRNKPQIDKVRAILSERGFFSREIPESESRSTFVVTPKFTVSFRYVADLENCVVHLKIDNFEGTWSQMVRYAPDSISEDLLDETAKYILGKPNRFQEMSGNVVSEDMREKLRARLQRDGKIPAAGAAQSNQPPQKEDKLESTASKIKGILTKKL